MNRKPTRRDLKELSSTVVPGTNPITTIKDVEASTQRLPVCEERPSDWIDLLESHPIHTIHVESSIQRKILFFYGHRATIGRDPARDITLNSPDVSRHHLTIERANGQWFAHEPKTGTMNGTRIHGEQLVPGAVYPVTWGTLIQIGKSSRVRIYPYDKTEETPRFTDPTTGLWLQRVLHEWVASLVATVGLHRLIPSDASLWLCCLRLETSSRCSEDLSTAFFHHCGHAVHSTSILNILGNLAVPERTADLVEFYIISKNAHVELERFRKHVEDELRSFSSDVQIRATGIRATSCPPERSLLQDRLTISSSLELPLTFLEGPEIHLDASDLERWTKESVSLETKLAISKERQRQADNKSIPPLAVDALMELLTQDSSSKFRLCWPNPNTVVISTNSLTKNAREKLIRLGRLQPFQSKNTEYDIHNWLKGVDTAFQHASAVNHTTIDTTFSWLIQNLEVCEEKEIVPQCWPTFERSLAYMAWLSFAVAAHRASAEHASSTLVRELTGIREILEGSSRHDNGTYTKVLEILARLARNGDAPNAALERWFTFESSEIANEIRGIRNVANHTRFDHREGLKAREKLLRWLGIAANAFQHSQATLKLITSVNLTKHRDIVHVDYFALRGGFRRPRRESDPHHNVRLNGHLYPGTWLTMNGEWIHTEPFVVLNKDFEALVPSQWPRAASSDVKSCEISYLNVVSGDKEVRHLDPEDLDRINTHFASHHDLMIPSPSSNTEVTVMFRLPTLSGAESPNA